MRAEAVVFAVKEKVATPLTIVPIVSQLWSLEGAKIPLREVVEGSIRGWFVRWERIRGMCDSIG